MTTQPAAKIWTACHSALQLDRYLLGELPAAEADPLRAHIAGCAPCTAAVTELQASDTGAALPPLKLVPPVLFPLPLPLPSSHSQRPPSRARWQTLAAAATGLAAAASLALVLRAPTHSESRAVELADSTTRLKGTSAPVLTMFVQHQGQVRRAGPGDSVAAGDAVRFAVTSPHDAWVAVLSRDPRGHGSIYFPLGARTERVPAGAEVALPLSTQLDGTLGEEQLVGLFCPGPVELEPLRSQLEGGKAVVPEGCQVTRWTFVKQ